MLWHVPSCHVCVLQCLRVCVCDSPCMLMCICTHRHGWRAYAVACAVPPFACAVIVFAFVHESPRFLLAQRKEAEVCACMCVCTYSCVCVCMCMCVCVCCLCVCI